MKKAEFVAMDTETGGLDPKVNPILTIYMVSLDKDLNFIEEIDLKIRPSEPYSQVDAGALAVNKIDIEAHSASAETLDRDQAAVKVKEFLSRQKSPGKYGKPNILGHNVDFDVRMILEQLMSNSEWESLVGYATRDTKKVSDFLKDFNLLPPEIGNLGSLIKHFQIPYVGAHTAKGDVIMTIEAYKRLGQMVSSSGGKGLSLDVLDILEK